MRLLAVAVLSAGLGASLTAVVGATAARRQVRAIEAAATLPPGQGQDLFVVRGYHYGELGLFRASCSRSGRAKTSYVLGRATPDEGVAMDGRGSSRGAISSPAHCRAVLRRRGSSTGSSPPAASRKRSTRMRS